jgi:signal transduction histidine kinase
MRRSLRFRATAGAVVVVGAALLAGSVGLVLLIRESTTDNVREAAELRAEDVAATLEGRPVSPVDLAVEDDQDSLIQVLDPRGVVLAASGNVAGQPAVADLRAGDQVTLHDPPIGQDDFVAVAVGADTTTGPVTVLVARALDDVNETTWAVTRLLLVGGPLLLLVVGVVAWHMVGRALAPVEEMRRTVDNISGTDLDRRVPEPGGRDEIARLATTMNGMLNRLSAARDRMAGFVSDAAHELRSPVASMRQHAEVALRQPERTDVVELAEVVRDENLRLQRLVDDLLLLARADERALGASRRPVDLDDLALDVVDRVRATSGVTVDVSGVSGGQVLGDEAELDRLIGNLVENAARHADQRVDVRLAERDGSVVLTVDDDGPGIPVEDREQVFERFVRLDEARSRDAGGSGLGLAIVAEVARAHDSVVTVGTSPAGGARVTVTFPAA